MFKIYDYIKKVPKIPNRLFRIIERYLNQRHSYDYPDQNNGWEKYGDCPVLGNKDIGTFFDPYVLLYNNDFVMYVSERSRGAIARFSSSNGITWNNKYISLEGRPNSWDMIVNRCSVIHHDGLWKMWFTGQNNGISSIGYCESEDGISFKRIYDNPIISADLQHEGISVMNPCVIWDEEKRVFKMWYSAGEDYEPDVICYAESKDGISWIKWNKPVLSADINNKWEKYKVGGCSVIKEEKGTYKIYYIGYQNLDVARICEAYSDDGINWHRVKNNLLLSPSRKSWDADAVYKPSIVVKDGCCLMWYNGRKSHNEYIGLVIKKI